MTRVVFYVRGGVLYGVSARGHSGYAEAGADIVCAAVSSALSITEHVVTVGAAIPVKPEVTAEDAGYRLAVPGYNDRAQQAVCDAAFQAARAWLTENAKQYPAALRVETQPADWIPE